MNYTSPHRVDPIMNPEDYVTKNQLEDILKAQQTAFEGFLRVYMDSVSSRIDGIIVQVTEVKCSVESLKLRVNELSAKDHLFSEQCDSLQEATDKLADQTDYLENQSRRNNIRVDGVAELPNESWEATELKVRDTLVSKLGFSNTEAANFHVERAHRTGKPRSGTNTARSIVVKLNSYKDREAIIKRARERRPTGIYFNEDLSTRVLDARRAQLPELKHQKSLGKIAYFRLDKLVVREKRADQL